LSIRLATEQGALVLTSQTTRLDLYVRNVSSYAPNPSSLLASAGSDDTPNGYRASYSSLIEPEALALRASGDAAAEPPTHDFGRINLATGQTTLFESTLIDFATGAPHRSSSEPSLYFVDLDVGPGGLFEILIVCGLSGWATASEGSEKAGGLFDGVISRVVAAPVRLSDQPLFAPFASEMGDATECVRFQGTERHGGANNPQAVASVERAEAQRGADVAPDVRKSVLPNLVKLTFPAGAH